MHRLIEKWTISWSHLDLFCFRETNQRYVLDLLKSEHGIDFLKIQFDLFRSILEVANPKIIVVCNALARDILNYKSSMGNLIGVNFEYEFDYKIGTPRIVSEGPLNDKPIFFSSMLSGQRALDRGSFERLGWHINYVLNIINN
ncbi:MAG: hypothetical protein IPP69_11475 [Flavobacteriales bacterium]|nr:hypothetical protein [Flavobacteriales bacterium]